MISSSAPEKLNAGPLGRLFFHCHANVFEIGRRFNKPCFIDHLLLRQDSGTGDHHRPFHQLLIGLINQFYFKHFRTTRSAANVGNRYRNVQNRAKSLSMTS